MLEAFKFDKTISALNKIKSDFLRFSIISDFILQIIFIGFYIYSIINNLNNTYLLVIYSVLLLLGILYLGFTIFTLRKKNSIKKKTKRNIQRAYRYSKLFIRLFTIGLSIYEVCTYEVSDLTIIITALTVSSFVIQIIIEICRILVSKYINLILTGFKMDIEEIKESKIGKVIDGAIHPKEAILDAINNKMSSYEDNSYNEEPIRDKTRDYLLKLAKKRNEKKNEFNQGNYNSSNDTLEDKVNELKGHIKNFIKK